MNYKDTLSLLTSAEKFHINLGLERMQKLAQIFDNPQDRFRIVHVAGTNGKGSVCAMLAKVLEKNGYKTGLYTSPHIKNYTERIKINFRDISEDDFAKYTELAEKTAKQNDISLTEFEILTMAAFLYFRDKEVDFAVMETGMGGRLDATNIIKKPVLSIITSISLDHTDRLGTSTEEISGEKAGIIKPETPVITAQNNAGKEIIEKKAKELNSPVLFAEKSFELIDIKNNIFSNGEKDIKLSLKGINQGENLALVTKACEYLDIKPEEALKEVVWQGRFEEIKDKNLIFDAAHNPNGTKLLKENLNLYHKGQKRAYLFGMLDTKDYKTAIKNLFTNEDEIFVTDNFAHNAVKKEILAEEIKNQFKNANVKTIDIENAPNFINYNFDGIKICCGSFYLLAKIY